MQGHITSGFTVMFLAASYFFSLHSHLLYPHKSYPFGNEVSTHHQVILGNPSIAWKNWKKPVSREGHTKTVIQRYYA